MWRRSTQSLYDQAGLMVRIDAENWIKCGVEFSDGQLLLSTVLTVDTSDWAVSLAPAMPDGFWLRVTVEKGAIRVQYSTDGKLWPLLRLAPFPVTSRYLVGPMCCTPERGWARGRFFAVFHRPGAAKGFARSHLEHHCALLS